MRELLDTIRHYAPRIVWTLVGATEAEVSALEAAAGRALPPAYREFLLAAGRHLGLFTPFEGRYDFSVDTARNAALETPPGRYLFIARDREGLDLDLYLDCAAAGDDPPVVAIIRGGGTPEPKDESFRRFWLTEAFVSLRMPLLLWRDTLVATRDDRMLLARLGALAAELRILPVPGTGGFHPCYDRGDVALEARHPPGLGVMVHVAAAEEHPLITVRRLLEERLGLLCIT